MTCTRFDDKGFNYMSIPTPEGNPPKAIWKETIYLDEIQRKLNCALSSQIEQIAEQKTDMVFAGYTKPTRYERIKWHVSIYFSNLWSAICGRRDDY